MPGFWILCGAVIGALLMTALSSRRAEGQIRFPLLWLRCWLEEYDAANETDHADAIMAWIDDRPSIWPRHYTER